ncbi:ABC transporter permease [Corynebacterium frankenforstense]
MYLAWREMLFARAGFLLMGVVLALMSMLVVIISGLTAGLVNDGVSGIKAMDSDVIAFAEGTQTDSAFTRSVVDADDARELAGTDGVAAAAPLGLSIVNAHNQDGTAVDLTLFGVEPGSFLAPEGLPAMSTGAHPGAPTATPHDVVVSSTLEDEGVAVGGTVTIDRLEIPLHVVGFTDGQRTFGHVDIAYLPLDFWQEVHAGARHGEAVDPAAYGEASVIAALVTGAFFLVWTIQRAGSIATLRAMGATRGFPLRDSLGQAVVVLAVSILVGLLIAVGLGSLLESTAMPYATELGPVLGGGALLFVSGLIGALVAVVRVTRTDPLEALGENR